VAVATHGCFRFGAMHRTRFDGRVARPAFAPVHGHDVPRPVIVSALALALAPSAGRAFDAAAEESTTAEREAHPAVTTSAAAQVTPQRATSDKQARRTGNFIDRSELTVSDSHFQQQERFGGPASPTTCYYYILLTRTKC
jgi:hypothetical protein